MKIGVPKEIKTLEFRVGMTPAGVRELVHDGHDVVVETNAGLGIGMFDEDYENAGATILDTAEEVFAAADMIVKVKEPQQVECKMLRDDQVLFTYLHLAADRGPDRGPRRIRHDRDCLRNRHGKRRLLAAADADVGSCRPAVDSGGCLSPAKSQRRPRRFARRRAGRNGRQGRHHRWRRVGHERRGHGDRHSARTSRFSIARCRACVSSTTMWGGRVHTVYSTKHEIDRLVPDADLVVGAVLVAGAAAPKLVSCAERERHARGRGHGRHLDRPGRLLRNEPADDTR